MKVSKLWLDKFFDAPLPDAQVLADALTFHAFEIEGVEKVASPRQGDEASDQVLDVKVTPNRGHDALSHRGIAAELSAILNIPLTRDPLKEKTTLEPKTSEVVVSIETPELCSRYIAGYIKGVQVGPSPAWLKARLEAVGQRSINNVVDATNFVMFNIGQPLHAFDAKQLSNKKAKYFIGVRKARVDEVMTALDGKNYVLGHDNLVIADNDLNHAIGVAGVKGGMPAAITEATKDIILESANFDGPTVRKSANSLNLRTDASQRFEQGLSSELSAFGIAAAAELIQKIAGGELVGYADEYPNPQKSHTVSVSLAQIEQVLGHGISESEIANIFERLGLAFAKEHGVFVVSVPFVRLDLTIPEDLIEEVARIRGFEKISPTELPPMHDKPTVNKDFYWAEHVREEMMQKGCSEVITTVFADKGERVVLNKVDGTKPYLRETLLDNLSEALLRNTRNKDLLALSEVKLFEIGPVWKGGKEIVMVGSVSEKEKGSEVALASLSKPLDQWAHYENLATSHTTRYKSFSKYPYIVRDIALWVAGGADASEIEKQIKDLAGPLATKIYLFDTFKKDDKVSLAFRLIFQSFERTLTEVEVNQVIENVASSLRQKGFEIR